VKFGLSAGRHAWCKEGLEMVWQRRTWLSSIITLLFLSVFMAGCPKRPEIAETAPKAIGPQGAIAMPAPSPSPPPVVSSAPPTVPAPPEQSPPEVTAQAQEPEVSPEAKLREVEASPVEGAGAAPSGDEGDVGKEPSIKEGDVEPGASAESKDAGAPGATKEGEVVPEPSAPIQETEVPSIGESQVKGADVTVPSPAEPSAGAAEPVAAPPIPTPSVPTPEPAVVAAAPKAPELTLKDIFFDFDQAILREDSRKTLADNAQWLRANPSAKLTIEGHCDERGSSEYNLALGERRARATREYLVAAGIAEGRISTISYGKERPFVLGHDESAWKWNRRAHFLATTK
jgi:peptidoglycan-associated lipoprotein